MVKTLQIRCRNITVASMLLHVLSIFTSDVTWELPLACQHISNYVPQFPLLRKNGAVSGTWRVWLSHEPLSFHLWELLKMAWKCYLHFRRNECCSWKWFPYNSHSTVKMFSVFLAVWNPGDLGVAQKQSTGLTLGCHVWFVATGWCYTAVIITQSHESMAMSIYWHDTWKVHQGLHFHETIIKEV